jgi:hypothetical protein
MATFGNRVTALTQNWLLPKVVDNTLGSNVLAYRLMGRAKQGKGSSIDRAIKYQNSGQATSFFGLDTFQAAPLDTKITLSYDMRGVRIPLAVSGMEAVANAVSQTQVTDLVKNTVEESETELADAVGSMVYSTGTGNNNKDFIGMGALVDDGTDVSTLGGASRSTYPVLNATRTASGGTLTLAKLSTLFSATSSGTATSTTTLITSDETVWDLYESLLTPTVRENYSMTGSLTVGQTGGAQRQEGLKGMGGFVALTFKGIPWVRDEKATPQTVWFLNENRIDYYGWDAKGMFGYNAIKMGSTTYDGLYAEEPMSNFTGFNWSGFRAPTNQFAGIADIIILGNFLTWEPRRNGRLTGVTSV